ncbi:molecular chaperone HscC [Devosia lucknowensis]|uniref:Molecular chaperone HscC n=1 Tax=Devosia lucknowensis TaxID=1096929 RepID=A0A1Y6FKY0_9HYPH|nr:Hsp70 family protein [Devosia lucknowensis]SMQ73063.1 molecular chaperone HscC [Devosia lucknowensis]
MTAIGIDLGTTNSLVSVFEDGRARLLPNALGDYLTPSVVGLADDGRTMLMGKAALSRLALHPDRTAARFKRLMGTKTSIKLGRSSFDATQLSAFVLRALKADAEAALGIPVDAAVISVPAYFNAIQRQATKDAAEIAGLKVTRLINEPTAAALATGLLDRTAETTFVVLDLGGGTFDVSVLEMFDGVMEVRASAGDAMLGGEDFTRQLARHLSGEAGIDFSSLPATEAEHLLSITERFKRELATGDQATASAQIAGRIHDFRINRNAFEKTTADLLARMRRPIDRCLYDARIDVARIDKVVLVGGATRMHAVRSLAARIFRQLPVQIIDPDHAIALGAAIQAGLATRDAALDDVVMTDVAPFSLGISSATRSGQHLLDGLFAPIIERNTPLPASRSRTFSTISDNQLIIEIEVYQGEAATVADNIALGKLNVPVPPAPAGREAIDVRFTYDTSGLLAVDTTILSTSAKFSTLIDNLAQALSPAEKARRLQEMDALKVHPREDARNRALLEAIDQLHAMLLGEDRAQAQALRIRFEVALAGQDPKVIELERERIVPLLDHLERALVR